MKRINSDKVFDVVNLVVMLVMFMVFLWPLWFVLIASISDPTQLHAGHVLLWPKGITLEGYKYALGQRDGDVRSLLKKMNLALNGRGGGKPFFAQGSLKGKQKEILEFFRGEGFTPVTV